MPRESINRQDTAPPSFRTVTKSDVHKITFNGTFQNPENCLDQCIPVHRCLESEQRLVESPIQEANIPANTVPHCRNI